MRRGALLASHAAHLRATKILREPLFTERKRCNVEVVDWLAGHPEVRTVVVSQIVSRAGVVPARGRTKFQTAVAGYAAAWRGLPASVRRVVVVRDTRRHHLTRVFARTLAALLEPGLVRAVARAGPPSSAR